jgi:hypothetical protein
MIHNVLINEGKISAPGGFILERFELTNYAGAVTDIRNLVNSISIDESIYSSALQLKFSVFDESNMFDNFELRGRERIHITITAEDAFEFESLKKIDLHFVVTEYPMFVRPNTTSSVFEVNAIAEHAYLSTLKLISREVAQPSLQGEIERILVNDLGFPEEDIDIIGDGSKTAANPLAIPGMSPLHAVEFLRRRCTNEFGSVFFVYQTISGRIHLAALSDLKDLEKNPRFRENYFAVGSGHIAGETYTANTYARELVRIRQIASVDSAGIFSTIRHAIEGAYATKQKSIDIENKEYFTEVDLKQNIIGDVFVHRSLSSNESSEERTIEESPDAHIEVIYNTESSRYSQLSRQLCLSQKRDLKKLNEVSWLITLPGDLNMRVGNRIHLVSSVPWYNSDDKGEQDRILSGDYIVAMTRHIFESAGHSMICTIKKI